MKVDKRKFDNSWYKPGKSVAVIYLWYFINALFFLNPLFPLIKSKVLLLKLFGAKIGQRCYIKPGVNIKYPWKLEIGDYVSIGENVWIDNLADVYLGDMSTISQGAMLLTGNHNYKIESFDLMVAKIKIEEGAWVGAQSVVGPGVTCKSHSILAVGSVTTSDLKEYTIYRGNPAIEVAKRKIEPKNV